MTIDEKLTIYFAVNYQKIFPLDFLITSMVPRIVLLKMYEVIIAYKVSIPIELLLKEEKIALTDKCRETGLFFTNKTLTEASMILYTLNYFRKNNPTQ